VLVLTTFGSFDPPSGETGPWAVHEDLPYSFKETGSSSTGSRARPSSRHPGRGVHLQGAGGLGPGGPGSSHPRRIRTAGTRYSTLPLEDNAASIAFRMLDANGNPDPWSTHRMIAFLQSDDGFPGLRPAVNNAYKATAAA
jgi:hypothetical protein